MVRAWMGKGYVMPSRARASTRSAGTPSASKVVLIGEVLAFVVVMGLVGEVGRFSVLHQRVRKRREGRR